MMSFCILFTLTQQQFQLTIFKPLMFVPVSQINETIEMPLV